MVETSRFFVAVSVLFCVASVVYGFTESGSGADPEAVVFAVPAGLPAQLPQSMPVDTAPAAPPLLVASTSEVFTESVPDTPDDTLVARETPPPAPPVPSASRPAAVPQPVVTETPADLAALAELIHAATNRARQAEGLPPLQYDATLAKNATAYSRRMQREDFLGHTDPDGCALTCRFAASGYQAMAWGENLARWRSSYDPEVSELASFFMREWLRSDGHRDNILSPDFTVQGVGFSIEGGEVYVTVHFADPA